MVGNSEVIQKTGLEEINGDLREADLLGPFLAIRLTIKFIEHVPPGTRRGGT
jgi:hypothetical protein